MSAGSRTRISGLTLLELLVVLLLMGLMTAMVAPTFSRQLDNAKSRALQRQLRGVVEQLPLQAFRAGQALDVGADDLLKSLGPDWPFDMRLELPRSLHYEATGIASGGELRVRKDGQVIATFYISPMTGLLGTEKPSVDRAI